jgi:sterol desaturase/sphingolipid hydroxylase (fatty acid hydroxylase superfamily)
MPTPLELLSDPVSLISFALYATLLACETLAPARRLPRVSGWWLQGIAAFLAFFFVSAYLPLWLSPWLAPYALWDASALGTWGGGLLALCLYELLAYGYHRALHGSDTLFRMFHQMHHSAERLDVSGAFWFSPLDMLGFTCMSTLALSIVGFTPGAVTAFALANTLLAIFQHTNVRTPVWLGYIVQRPESHSYHHARQIHRDNYADLPIVDMLFGTFVNPREFAEKQGYYDGASQRVPEMLLCRDVTSATCLRTMRTSGEVTP